ncbi:MAG: hypothetical protein MRK00_09120 [Nitrosomonas sp.]|nr:hypothetical protein [Nitrosomonas sp.]
MQKYFLIAFCYLLLSSQQSFAGSIFLTGHDPDFHASNSSGTAIDSIGAVHINQTAINYILDPTFNTFAAGGTSKFLFVESNISVPAGHRHGVNGIIQSGYALGVDFEHHTASTLGAELNLLGTKYAGIVIASDFGGILTQAELDILNFRSGDIINFINAGGGLYAMAEGNSGTGLTPGGGHFGFLPFVVSSTGFNQSEAGTTVTAFGASLGLTDADVSANFSHNIFNDAFGLNVVDRDSAGQILTLAGRPTTITPGGVVSEPAMVLLFTLGLILLTATRQQRILFRR